MYIQFDVRYNTELEDIKREIKSWADRHGIRYSQKTIKYTHRLGFDHDGDFTVFFMTWNPVDLDKRPWLKYQTINIANERY